MEEVLTGIEPVLIGNYLRVQRKENGFSLESLSAKCGISKQYLADIENAKKGVPLKTINIVFMKLGIQYTYNNINEESIVSACKKCMLDAIQFTNAYKDEVKTILNNCEAWNSNLYSKVHILALLYVVTYDDYTLENGFDVNYVECNINLFEKRWYVLYYLSLAIENYKKSNYADSKKYIDFAYNRVNHSDRLLNTLVTYYKAKIESKLSNYYVALSLLEESAKCANEIFAYELSFKASMKYNSISSDYIDSRLSLEKNLELINAATLYFPKYEKKLRVRRCNMFKKFGLYEECITYCNELLAKNYKDDVIYYSLIFSYYKLGDYQSIMKIIESEHPVLSEGYKKDVVSFILGAINNIDANEICPIFLKSINTTYSKRSYLQGIKLISDYYVKQGNYEIVARISEAMMNDEDRINENGFDSIKGKLSKIIL